MKTLHSTNSINQSSVRRDFFLLTSAFMCILPGVASIDWVERLFHVSPDSGSGWFELLTACIFAVALLAVMPNSRAVVRRIGGEGVKSKRRLPKSLLPEEVITPTL